jgi:hypothetical protein
VSNAWIITFAILIGIAAGILVMLILRITGLVVL